MSKKIQFLDVDVGDIIVCVAEASSMFTEGCKYLVKQAAVDRKSLLNGCGILATTTASLCTKGNLRNGYPRHDLVKRVETNNTSSETYRHFDIYVSTSYSSLGIERHLVQAGCR